MNFTPAFGIAAVLAGFYQMSGGAGFQAAVAEAAVVTRASAGIDAPDPGAAAPVGASAEAAPEAATPNRIAAVRAAFEAPARVDPATDAVPTGPTMVRIRRGDAVESVRIRRVAAPVRKAVATPDADAAFQRIFDAAAQGIVLPGREPDTVARQSAPVEFTVTEVAAPGTVSTEVQIGAIDAALDGVLDLREVIGDGVNMRGGPGVQYAVVGKLSRGERAEVLREESGWAELRLASGETGWMAANFLR